MTVTMAIFIGQDIYHNLKNLQGAFISSSTIFAGWISLFVVKKAVKDVEFCQILLTQILEVCRRAHVVYFAKTIAKCNSVIAR